MRRLAALAVLAALVPAARRALARSRTQVHVVGR